MPRPLALPLDALALPLRQALPVVARCGAAGLLVDAVGPLAPSELTATGRREVRRLLADHRLELAALACPLRSSLLATADLARRREWLWAACLLAAVLGPRLVTLSLGPLPEPAALTALPFRQAFGELAAYAEKVGVHLALSAGAEPVARLAEFAADWAASVGIALDPGLLLMRQQDPSAAVASAAAALRLVTARDVRLSLLDRPSADVPLGQGDVDWFGLAAALEAAAYQGWVVLRGPSPLDAPAASAAVAFLKRLGI